MLPILQNQVTIYCGDCRDVLLQLPAGSVHTCVTSPPYWGLRDYGVDGQLGLEPVPDCLGWAGGDRCGECFVCHLVSVFAEVRRALRDDGTLWLILGDTYAGYWGKKYAPRPFGEDRTPDASTPPNKPSPDFRHWRVKPKNLMGIPWRVALALQADGWFLRSEIIWSKPNPMPESVRDRPTCSHERLFLLSKSPRYHFDQEAIREPCVSGPSDIRKMQLKRARMGGKHKHLDDPLSKANCRTQIGQRRAVGSPNGRNRRSVWTVSTKPYSGAHFAVFPPELITPCILAGTSEAGCCASCGAPYRRIFERHRVATRPGRETKTEGRGTAEIGNRDPRRHVTQTRTLYWEPACTCDAGDPVPCTVLDPFLGSGTTAAVAERLGCRCIGIELNEAYCRLAVDRFRQGSFLTSVRFGECGTSAGKPPATDAVGEAA
jgi:DNA modification methylase